MLTDQEREAMSAKAREILTEKPAWKIPVSDAAKIAECSRLIDAEIAGECVPFEALNWMRAWRHSPLFKIHEEARRAFKQAQAEAK